MALSPESSTSLELTMSMPGFSSSPYLPSSGEGGYGIMDLDINQVPPGDEEWMVCGGMDYEEDSSNGAAPRKKLRLSKEQSRLLEESFRQNHSLNPGQKEALASRLKLRPRQVEVWFQNRRARSKLKQTERECEYLRKWFGSLREQNRILQREVEELRAMKVGPPTVISPHNCEPLAASTLTMCPRCKRVTTTSLDKKLSKSAAVTTATETARTLSHKVGTFSLQSRHPSAAC